MTLSFGRRRLEALASLRLTLIILVWSFTGVVTMLVWEVPGHLAVAPPLVLLSLNLIAAILSNPKFRSQMPLLVFHLALLALTVLAAVGQLTGLRATAEVAVGGEFEGFKETLAGPLYRGPEERIRFVNEGFRIEYRPGLIRERLSNRVRRLDAEATVEEIGDHRPLVMHGYRFYPTSNKGYAPVFRWQPKQGAATTGGVHLPPYPGSQDQQWQDWSPPGSKLALYTRLEILETVLESDRPTEFRVPTRYELIMRHGDERWTMRPGDRREFAEGTLTFDHLGSWMGYIVFYDWTLPWLFAAGVLAAAAIGWHFWQKWSRRPWWQE